MYSAGAEEPSAFVEVDAPCADPVVAATMVDLEEGWSRGGVPGVGRLPADGRADAVRANTATRTSRRWWSAAGSAGVAEANGAAARAAIA